jgi:hypothetical protein
MRKQNNLQCETIKSLENEIKKCNMRKQELEADVLTMIEHFQIAKNSLTKIVCIQIIYLFIFF